MIRTPDFPIAFHMVTYAAGPRGPESDAAIVDNCVTYSKQYADKLCWFVDDQRGRFKRFELEDLETIQNYLSDLSSAPKRYWMAHGGETKLKPSAWSMYGSLDGDPGNDLELRWPPEFWAADWSKAVGEVIERLKGRPLLQGRAGFCFAEVQGEECFSKARALLAGRFQGVDIAEISSGGIWAGRGLGSATWLTAIGNVFVDKLGGRKAFATLDDDIVVHELGAGLLVQAGEKPSLGDVNAGDTLPLYRKVAKFLMPTRYHGHIVWTNVMPPDAKAWLARLDP